MGPGWTALIYLQDILLSTFLTHKWHLYLFWVHLESDFRPSHCLQWNCLHGYWQRRPQLLLRSGCAWHGSCVRLQPRRQHLNGDPVDPDLRVGLSTFLLAFPCLMASRWNRRTEKVSGIYFDWVQTIFNTLRIWIPDTR